MALRRLVPMALRRSVNAGSKDFFLRVYDLLPEATRVYIASKASIVRPMDYAREQILLSIRSETEYKTRTHSCRKEPETVAWIEEAFRPGDVFYDVGANVGAYALIAAKFHRGTVRVVAFEPSFANYGQLCTNLLLNRCGDTVSPMPLALTDRTGLDQFNYQDVATGAAYNALGVAVDHRGERFEPRFHHDVPCITMTDFVRWFGVPPPNHLKVDVDGIEMAVMRGARELLADARLRSVLVEARVPDGERELVEFFEPLGLRLDSRYRRYQSEFYNCIFRRAS